MHLKGVTERHQFQRRHRPVANVIASGKAVGSYLEPQVGHLSRSDRQQPLLSQGRQQLRYPLLGLFAEYAFGVLGRQFEYARKANDFFNTINPEVGT